ncbi:MAG TPA: hypothetical protein VKA89_08265, partial [Solirubrobacterales bacterium]|nr:hypothetical protein [Solirubrobacterales bacterium]
MRRVARILSLALITAGLVVLADVGMTLAYREPVSAIYGAVRAAAAADDLEGLEDRYARSGELARVAEIRRAERKVRILARRFERRIGSGEAVGRIKAAGMDGLDAVLIEGTDAGSLQKGPGH